MSVRDRLRWIERGSPFRLMRPAAALRDRLRAHGYVVYDIGNRAHLEHEPPEDHTPYSETGWPSQTATYGVGHAIDIMPPTPGQRSKLTGALLPSLAQLGAQIHNDKQAGQPGTRWIKYMNWEPLRGQCLHCSWQPGHAQRSSTDRGHIHLSGRTDYIDSASGDGYDPVARLAGEDDDMPLTKGQDGALQRVNDLWGGNKRSPWQNRLDATLGAILVAIKGDADAQQIIAGVRAELTASEQRTLTALTEQVGPAILDELRAELAGVADERLVAAVETGLRRVVAAVAAQG